MKLNQKAFGAIETLLIIVIVAILGGTGYYVYHANKATNDTLNAAAKDASGSPKFSSKKATAKPPSKPVDPTAGWKTYSSPTGAPDYSFKYPGNWTLSTDHGQLSSPDGFTMKIAFTKLYDDKGQPVQTTETKSTVLYAQPVNVLVNGTGQPAFLDYVGSSAAPGLVHGFTLAASDSDTTSPFSTGGYQDTKAYKLSVTAQGTKDMSVDAAKSDSNYFNAYQVVISFVIKQ